MIEKLNSAAAGARADRLQGIQALRAVAALMVVVYHVTRVAVDRVDNLPPSLVWKPGEAGVDIFFAISGLVMGITYYRRRSQNWRDFLSRRLTRIVPMYWIATSLKLAVLLTIPVLAVHTRFDPWHAAASYLFIPAKNLDGSIYPVLWVGWTLNFEMFFYVLFTAALALRAPLLGFLSAAIGLLAFAGLWRSSGWPAPLRLVDPILLEFLCGLWIAAAMARGLTLSPAVRVGLVLGGIIFILLAPNDTDESMTRVLFWGLPAFAIVAATAATPWSPPNWLLQLGNASYAIYLFHGFVMTAIGMLMRRFEFNALMLVACGIAGVVLSALAGLAVYKFVETPLLKGLNAWVKRNSLGQVQRVDR
jgi:peptidoglycan/LPS O-acetylase OafA/YrhL